MEKLMQLKEYLLEIAFLALLVRVAAVGCGIGEALAMISVVSSMGYNKYLTKSKIEQYEELNNKIKSENEALKSEIHAEFIQLIESHKDLTAKVSSIAMDKSIRRTNESQVQNYTNDFSISPAGATNPAAGSPAKRYF